MALGASLRSRVEARLVRWARRRQGEDRFPLRLASRRLYILPTRAGLGFALLLCLMLLAGLNYANSLALFFTFLLGGAALVAMHLCQRNLLALELESLASEPVFAGEAARVRLRLRNPTRLARFGLDIEAGAHSGLAARLDAAGATDAELALPCPRRGRVRIERLRLSTRHPFGLFRAWTWVHAPLEILVYPAPRGRRPAPPGPGRREGTHAGDAPGSEEWSDLRAFRDGDSPRRVDWRAYARGAPLLVKECVASGGDERLFEFAALGDLGTEARLEQLASWIVEAEAGGGRYGLVLPDARIAPERGPAHRHRCLAALALHGLARMER